MQPEVKVVLSWWVAIILMVLVIWVGMTIVVSYTYAHPYPPQFQWMPDRAWSGQESETIRKDVARVWHEVRQLHAALMPHPDREVAMLMAYHEASNSYLMLPGYRVWYGKWSAWIVPGRFLEGLMPGDLKVLAYASYEVLCAYYYRRDM